MKPRMVKSAGSEGRTPIVISITVAYRAEAANTIRNRVAPVPLAEWRPLASDLEPRSRNRRTFQALGCGSVCVPHRVLCLVRHRKTSERPSRAIRIRESIHQPLADQCWFAVSLDASFRETGRVSPASTACSPDRTSACVFPVSPSLAETIRRQQWQ
jgi:hypothetical protein